MKTKTFCLCGNVAPWSKGGVKEFKVGLLEERGSGADGIGGVGDDSVVRGGVVGEELEAVANEDRYTGIGKEGGHVGEELLGDADDGLVQVLNGCLWNG